LDAALNPVRLLIFEPSFAPIQAELAGHGRALAPLVMDRAGVMRLAGAPISADEARPDAAWASGDLFESPAARDFLAATLKSPRLTWVQSGAAGFDHPIFARIVDKGARLTTSHGQAIGMADHVVAGVLDHFQRGPERRAAQAEHAWRRLPFREVLDTTWLVIGFGAIGQAVAQRTRGFGARVIGVRRDPSPHPLADRILSLEAMTAALPEADVVVLCLPASAATRHLADAGFFAVMKPGAVLVNVGRGALVDEGALLAALDLGKPAHAVLDVFEAEPLPGASRLWSHPRVSLTAHCSGDTGGQTLRNQALFLDNLARFLGGRALLGEVDPLDVLDRRSED
jgi:phosphoglycerate dehydrogenase-like enzyme